MSKQKSKPSPTATGLEPSRRNFLGLLAGFAAAAVAFFVPIYAGIRSVIFPLEQQGLGGKFYPLTTLDNLSQQPQKFPIVDDVVDAWVTVPKKTIGNVYLRLNEADEVQAFQTLCPHAGCTIGVQTEENPKTKTKELLFTCPCHVAHFDLNGQLLDAKPDAPRNMDTLVTKVEDGRVFVRFEVFAFGTPEKKSS
ncbi:MAG: Rieske (2Fe-2S) protein [Planctomycetaceae bacterium]|jgi:menaquinol-cytochrome c reductase iron-sulfur subunit|nr:Rieske (2Fe-2S) protein [Planctomycetaceae bacterium]